MATRPIDLSAPQVNLAALSALLDRDGYYILPSVLRAAEIDATKTAMQKAKKAIQRHVGKDRLDAANEAGVLRLMMRFDPFFYRFLNHPVMVELVDYALSPTAVLHLQNGLIMPMEKSAPSRQWQRDYPRLMNGYRASLNVMVTLTAFDTANGAPLGIPGSQHGPRPSESALQAKAVGLHAPAGSFIVFDSTLWHCAGANTSEEERYTINHQFTCSWFKQQIDYVRALGETAILELPERTQQMLGYFTRAPASLDDYYRPAGSRLYRAGQG